MELRSMRRLPLYMHDKKRFMNSQNVSTTRKQNGHLQTHFYFHDIPFAISFSFSALILKALKINPSLKIKGQSKTRVKEEDNSPPVIVKDVCIFPKCKCLVYSVSGFLIILLCVVWISLVFPYPMHASCIVKWKFEDPCKYVMQKFRSQILNWSSYMNCGPRCSKCLYTLKEPKPNESTIIKATHFAPNMKTMETIKIDFEEINKTCVATGESVSNEWFRIFDYGINYCNLHNLVTEIGFDKSSKFLELTTNAVCTQYNMAVCN